MTSTYDNLGNLWYESKQTPKIRELVETIYDYAIAEINKVNPKLLNWETWNGRRFYDDVLEQKAYFLSDAHSILDHTAQYHFKTVSPYLDMVISRVTDWFVRYKDRKDFFEKFFRFGDFGKLTRDKYPKVFQILKRMVKEGYIKIPEDKYYDRLKKKIELW